MREIPILFSTPMVQAILDGRKSMTRRIVKPQPDKEIASMVDWHTWSKCPYGQPGDRLYVKENTWIWCRKQRNGLTPTGKPKYLYVPVGQHVVYHADHPAKPDWRIDDNPEHDWRLKVARFMPKWAARTWLENMAVRVERLQDILCGDMKREGCMPDTVVGGQYQQWQRDYWIPLWDSVNKKRGYGWDTNPWVWVIEFKKVTPCD